MQYKDAKKKQGYDDVHEVLQLWMKILIYVFMEFSLEEYK